MLDENWYQSLATFSDHYVGLPTLNWEILEDFGGRACGKWGIPQ